ncbi:MAG: hypothetical protein HRT74_03150 [Flavobacteriales bacterium]|nr:hypothetical protein [Flavobacteriales bacterium]
MIAISLLIGLGTLIRPTAIVAVLIPLLWGVGTKNSLAYQLFKHSWKGILRGFLPAFLIISLQLIYWKVVTNKWLFYSYNNAGEGLDLLSPYIFNVLFSYRKGWLLYTPLMIFAICGLAPFLRSKKPYKWSVFTVLIIQFYLAASWTNWWYAESFSQRSLIELYALWLIPLGMMLQIIWKSRLLRPVVSLLLIGIVCLNLFQSWQTASFILHPSRTTKGYYWEVFGQTKIPEGAQRHLLFDRAVPRNTCAPEEYSLKKKLHHEFPAISVNDSSDLQMFHSLLDLNVEDISPEHPSWLMMEVNQPEEPKDLPDVSISMIHNGNTYGYFQGQIDWVYDKKEMVWRGKLCYLIPEIQRPGDHLRFQLYNPNPTFFTLDKLRLYSVWQNRAEG